MRIAQEPQPSVVGRKRMSVRSYCAVTASGAPTFRGPGVSHLPVLLPVVAMCVHCGLYDSVRREELIPPGSRPVTVAVVEESTTCGWTETHRAASRVTLMTPM